MSISYRPGRAPLTYDYLNERRDTIKVYDGGEAVLEWLAG